VQGGSLLVSSPYHGVLAVKVCGLAQTTPCGLAAVVTEP
jgi:hypothetical protein